jgi:ParB/RepB/Spo0J family partition protein
MPEKIELEKIRVPEWAIRSVMDEAELKELARSIEAHGLIEPIVVRPTSDGCYELISGYRRLQALKVLNAKEVEAKVVECTDEEALALSIEENEKRAEEHPFDVARKVAYMHDALGMSDEKIANKLGRERSWVVMMLKINAIGDEAKKVLAPKVRDIAKLYSVAKINSPEKQLIAANVLAKRNLSRKEVEDLAKQANPLPVEEFRAYCERLLKGEGEVQGGGAEGAGGVNMLTPPQAKGPLGQGAGEAEVSSRLDTSQGQVQPPVQGPQTSQEQGKAPETRECYICGEERGRKEIKFYAICKDRHSGLHELMRDMRRYGSENVDNVLEAESHVRYLLLSYPPEQRGEIAKKLAELVPHLQGLGVELFKQVVEEVKRRLAQNQD